MSMPENPTVPPFPHEAVQAAIAALTAADQMLSDVVDQRFDASMHASVEWSGESFSNYARQHSTLVDQGRAVESGVAGAIEALAAAAANGGP